MLLIISGQYVESELAAEFGKIPPAFLPLGNQRLYMRQVGQLSRHYRAMALTLPSDFEVDDPDTEALAALGVAVHRTAVGSSLGAAVREALGKVDIDGRIDILYGDTLVYEDELGGTNWIAVGGSDDFYPWHYESHPHGKDSAPQLGHGHDDLDEKDESGGEAWAGMFSFSSARALQFILTQTEDFIAAVTRYGLEHEKLERRSLNHWLDFGHVQTYFHSRLAVTTQRHFNQLAVEDGVLTKSSADGQKMRAEATWFETAPVAIKPFLPKLISSSLSNGSGYAIEYLPLVPLNELYVFGRLPVKVWRKVFGACDRYLSAACSVPVPIATDCGADFASRLYRSKTATRLDAFSRQSGVDLERPWRFNGRVLPSLCQIAEQAAAAASESDPVASFVHGDFCFSNVLFDFRSGRIKLIDPRGLDAEGNITSFGDLRYDIAKLAHSVLGLYDVIVAGRFNLRTDGYDIDFNVFQPVPADICEAFCKTTFAGRTVAQWNCLPIMVLLFLSMLPLHVDNPLRQRALMANCLRLYEEMQA
ncbi:MAG: hypothetical protein JWP96_1041 [Polaromonas sp.]|nr:hypothetical protein [Polaromonas sp.]